MLIVIKQTDETKTFIQVLGSTDSGGHMLSTGQTVWINTVKNNRHEFVDKLL